MCPTNSNNNNATRGSHPTKFDVPLYINLSDEELGKLFWGKAKRNVSEYDLLYADMNDFSRPKDSLTTAMLNIAGGEFEVANLCLEEILQTKDKKSKEDISPHYYDYVEFFSRLSQLAIVWKKLYNERSLAISKEFGAVIDKNENSVVSTLDKEASEELSSEQEDKAKFVLIRSYILLYEKFKSQLSTCGRMAIFQYICDTAGILNCSSLDVALGRRKNSEQDGPLTHYNFWNELGYMGELCSRRVVGLTMVDLFYTDILPELKIVVEAEIIGSAKGKAELKKSQKFKLLTDYTIYKRSILSIKEICELCEEIKKLKLVSRDEVRALFSLLAQIGELLHNRNVQLDIKLKYLGGARVLKKLRDAVVDVNDRKESIETLIDRVMEKHDSEEKLDSRERQGVIKELCEFAKRAKVAVNELEAINFENKKKIKELHLKMDGKFKKQLQDELKEILSGINENKKKEILEIVAEGIDYDIGVFPVDTNRKQEIVVFSEESRKKLNICIGDLDEPIQVAITEKVASKLEEKNQTIKDHNNCKSGKISNLENLLKIAEIGKFKLYNRPLNKLDEFKTGMLQEMRVLKEILRGLNPEAFGSLQTIDPTKMSKGEAVTSIYEIMLNDIDQDYKKRAKAYMNRKDYKNLASYIFQDPECKPSNNPKESRPGSFNDNIIPTVSNCLIITKEPDVNSSDKIRSFKDADRFYMQKQELVKRALDSPDKQIEGLRYFVGLTKLTKAARDNSVRFLSLNYSIATLTRYIKAFNFEKAKRTEEGFVEKDKSKEQRLMDEILERSLTTLRNIMCHNIYVGTPDKVNRNITYCSIAIVIDTILALDKYLAGSKSQAPSNNNNSMEAASNNSLPSTALSEHRAASTAYVGRGPN